MSAELVELRSFYAEPGFILLAGDGPAGAVGCVASRDLGSGTAEVRRLWATPGVRSRGLGRALMTAMTQQARERGARRLVLTTLPTMRHARALYADLGFTPTGPYGPDATEGLIRLGLDL